MSRILLVKIGQSLLFTGEFIVGGVNIDPSVVKFTIAKPDQTEQVFTFGVDANLFKVSTGVYQLTYTPTLAGIHRCKGVGSNIPAYSQTNLMALDETLFRVEAPLVT